jgi:hypothetical protein
VSLQTFQREIITPLVDERNKLDGDETTSQVVMAGELGDAVQKFVYWMKIKQSPKELAPFMQRCGDRLFGMGEVTAARDVFYAAAMDAARGAIAGDDGSGEEKKEDEATPPVRRDKVSGQKILSASMEDKQWSLGMEAQLCYASANCDVAATLAMDPEVKFPQSVASLRGALEKIQGAMAKLLHELPPSPCHENLAWLLLNGTVELYRICEPLLNLGFAKQVSTRSLILAASFRPSFHMCLLRRTA